MVQTLKASLYIGGEWISDTADRAEIINPATEEVIGTACMAGTLECEQAIAAARDAFDTGPWPRLSIAERVLVMRRLHDHLQGRREEIVDLVIREAGATQMTAQYLHFGIAMKHAGQLLNDAMRIQSALTPIELTPDAQGRTVLGTSVTLYEPIGVVSAITAYNFPFFLNVTKLFHALTMGNTLILKPSPYTPMQASLLGAAAEAAGLPRGVLNIINGGIDTGTRLTTDKRVDMVTFTGSDKVGADIMAQAAPTLKKVHMELGGKSALIVRADADLIQAAQAGLGGFTLQSGQGCALTTRHLVHNSVRKAYVETLGAMAMHIKVGNPIDPSVHMGPLIREAARQRTEHFVQNGLDSGATLVCGGQRPEGLNQGFYYSPTLFDDVRNEMRIAQEEIFGPVGVVIGFDTDEEAIALANDSAFGLHGGIFSADAGKAYQIATRVRTGGMAINGGAGTMLSAAPFGGYKRSGLGREYGREGLLEFTQTKSISFHAG
ncbi:aldehyde dehydrogenase family protein [Pseudomonas silvicola]|nr:aldehyde dehydrogenase family protein [Pseudomonas silvicola]